ncbi:ethyl acetate hydrolase-like [Ptychodera flava]|uniref:ethyl acetate hydrolase-like n=1 Tax=Ptychodera flava TaxID=63121 RepID=UPI00396A7226
MHRLRTYTASACIKVLRGNIQRMASIAEKRKHLHKEARVLLELIDKAGRPPLHKLPVKDARKATKAMNRLDGTDATLDGTAKEFAVPVSYNSEGVPITVYRPFSCPTNPAIWIYFHGGGFVIGDRAGSDATCKIIASKANCIVVNVEYRLAPEFKYPACIEDGVAVTRWIMENKQLVGAGSQSIVGVGGDSAGGTISANICHEVPGVDFQVLIYPAVDMTTMYPSRRDFSEGFMLEVETALWFHKHAFKRSDDMRAISAFNRDMISFRKQPPCLMIISDSDVLRDEGVAYAEKLRRANRHVEVMMINGMIHGFYTFPTLFKETCERAYKRTVEFIKAQEDKAGQSNRMAPPAGRL